MWNNKRKKEIQEVNPLPQDSTAGQSLLGSGTKRKEKKKKIQMRMVMKVKN